MILVRQISTDKTAYRCRLEDKNMERPPALMRINRYDGGVGLDWELRQCSANHSLRQIVLSYAGTRLSLSTIGAESAVHCKSLTKCRGDNRLI